ncbi:MAG: hypothetical protein M1290_00880 [Candidatus Thermoplasmatota archaeon]|nr:hypothetical protein [Candidatus Thermoplasmatota archaeon]MCL5789004.1 hypothetical protein [Candidatus Thermoplasmatota archaeon]
MTTEHGSESVAVNASSKMVPYRADWSKIMRRGLPMLFVPVVLLVLILLSRNFYFLEYFHAVAGSIWTGIDLFMGIFISYIMRGLKPEQRTEIATRLTPVMLFFMPAIATATVTAGIYVALSLKMSFFSPYLVAVGIIVIMMILVGFVIFLPNELRIFLEIVHGAKNVKKIVRLTMINLNLAALMLVLQISVILMMAHFATGVPL